MATTITDNPQPAAPELPRMSVGEHLIELRKRFVRSMLAIGIGAVFAWFLYPTVMALLVHPYHTIASRSLTAGKLIATGPLEGFSVRVKITTYLAVALAMPVILWQLWRFVTPGLYRRERRYAIPFVGAAALLFLMGTTIAYLTLPMALQWLSAVGGSSLTQAYTADKYFQLIAYTMLAFGIAFEFPILLVFLQLAGLVSPRWLRAHWRHAVVLIALVVAIGTPANDPISMFALAVPLWLFYGIAVVIGSLTQRARGTRS